MNKLLLTFFGFCQEYTFKTSLYILPYLISLLGDDKNPATLIYQQENFSGTAFASSSKKYDSNTK